MSGLRHQVKIEEKQDREVKQTSLWGEGRSVWKEGHCQTPLPLTPQAVSGLGAMNAEPIEFFLSVDLIPEILTP